MNDEDQEVPLYNEIFQYENTASRVDASKSEKLEGDSQESAQFHDKEGLLYLKSNTADMTCNSGLLRAFDTTH